MKVFIAETGITTMSELKTKIEQNNIMFVYLEKPGVPYLMIDLKLIKYEHKFLHERFKPSKNLKSLLYLLTMVVTVCTGCYLVFA